MEPGASPNRGGMLDQAPPQPPGGRPRASLMDTQQGQGPGGGGGLGAEASNPQVVALQGLAMMQQGSELLSSAIPQLAPPLTGLMSNLRQVIPQAMADQLAGIDSSGAGAGTGAPGAGAPMPPPGGQAPGPGAPAGM